MISSQSYTSTILNNNNNKKERQDQQEENQLISPLQLFVCFIQNKKMIIPLRNINYHLKIHKGLWIVELEQIYSTESFNHPLDLEYVFSINENAAIPKMKVKLGEQTVYGIEKEKEEANQEFDEESNKEKPWLIVKKIQDFHKQKDSKQISLLQITNQKQSSILFNLQKYFQTNFGKLIYLQQQIKIIKIVEIEFKLDLKRCQNTQIIYLTQETLHFTINKILRQYQILDILYLFIQQAFSYDVDLGVSAYLQIYQYKHVY